MLLLAVLALAQPPADYKHVTLVVPGGKMTVYTPDPEKGFYRGTRFASGGVIRDLEVGGFKLFGPWKGTHDPANADDITGPAEEFSMFDPPGYADAKPGDPFVKIGVGELTRANKDKYQFQGKYAVTDRGKWEWSAGPAPDYGTMVATHTLRSRCGYSYAYAKTISLRPGEAGGVELALDYKLTNTGGKPIATDVYNHNFFNVDGQPVGPRYSLTFPTPVKFTAESKFGEAARFDGGTYTFRRPLADKESAFGWLTDGDGQPLPHAFTFKYTGDAGKAVTVRVSSETPVSKFQTWSVRACMCPEPFSPVSVRPGETQTWGTRYAIRAE